MNWAHSVTTRVWLKAWANYEMSNENGISHFLEHLNFLWWEKYKTAREIKDAVMNIWWVVNWLTWNYRTTYYINSPYEYWEKQLDILSDMLVDASYPADAVENERWVVIQEIKKAKDDNAKDAYYQWRAFFLWNNSYWGSVLWSEKNIEGFGKEDFLKYKNDLYTKDNMVIVIAWKIDKQERLEKLIESKFWKLWESHKRNLPEFERNCPEEHEKYMEKWINQSRVSMFIPWVSCSSDEAIYCCILAWILGRRLYKDIREELGLCYWISAEHIGETSHWFFLVEAGLQRDKLSFWLEKINDVIDELLKFWIEQTELENIKNSNKWSMLINYETPPRIADFVANNYITLGKIVFPVERAEEFSRVTMKDIEWVLPLLERSNRYTFYIK